MPTTFKQFYELQFTPHHLHEPGRVTPKVRRLYNISVDRFLVFVGGDMPIHDINRQMVDAFAAWIVATGRGNDESAANYAKRITHICRMAAVDGFEPIGSSYRVPLPAAHDGTLRAYLTDVYIVERELAANSIYQLKFAVDSLDRFVGHRTLLTELSDELLNRFIIASAGELSPRTLKGRRAGILSIWRHAADGGHISAPGKVRKVKCPRPVPDAWTLTDLAAMIGACETMGRYLQTGIRDGAFLEAFVRAGYDTALRAGDLLALRKCDLESDGRVRLVQSKTGDGIVCRIRPSTLAAIQKTFPPQRELLFPWPQHKTTLNDLWKRMLRKAGLPTGRRQGPQKLRRTSATHLERIAGGLATPHLGHKSHDMAAKHYIDASLAYRELPLPPDFDKGDNT